MSKKKEDRSLGLADEIVQSHYATPSNRSSKRRKRIKADEDEYVTDKLSSKILQQARQQQDEVDEEILTGQSKKKKTKHAISTSLEGDFEDDDNANNSDEDVHVADEDLTGRIPLDEEEERALQMFMSTEPDKRMTLSDFIKDKINEKHTELDNQMSDVASFASAPPLDKNVIQYFRKVGELLSKFRSGRLPKPFKFLTCVSNWEELVCITEPDKWTAAAMYEATRIFSSSLTAKKVQRFYNLVLLPRCRDDIAEYKRLNYHLYMALKKALFKPGAFFKGILLPLCEARNCSLREAVIIGSILNKTSIPALHACAAVLKIAEMEYTGANSIFMRIIIDKGYTMPFKVIDALTFHFLRSEKRKLPVLWHQCFLTFVQRYKEDIAGDQKDALLDLIEVQNHHTISKEIRRELTNSKCRDVELPFDEVMS